MQGIHAPADNAARLQDRHAEGASPSAVRRTKRRRVDWLIVFFVIAAPVVFHQPLLRHSYGLLVVDEPAQHCEHVVVGADVPELWDEAARLFHLGAVEAILVVERKPTRPMQIGVAPRLGQLALDELLLREVPADSVEVIATDAVTSHQAVRALDRHAMRNPDAKLMVLSTATTSRYDRVVIDSTLTKSRSSQYFLHAVPLNTSDSANWWRSRTGLKRISNHSLRLLFVLCFGESQVQTVDRDQECLP